MSRRAWVEVTADREHVVRIFKNKKAAWTVVGLVCEMMYAVAVADIRHQIFVRSEGYCELCGVQVTESSGHMHEKQHRGKGGEISLANSVFICPHCHRDAHHDRNPRFFVSKPPDSGGFVTDNIKDGETVCEHMNQPFDCNICRKSA